MSKKKTVAWCLAGAVPIVLAAWWLPSLSFWWLFQKSIEGHDPGGAVGAVLWARIAEAEGRPAGSLDAKPASRAGSGWGRVLSEGLFVPMPPGDVVRIGRDGATLVVEFRSGSLTVDRFPAGTILGVYREALNKIGGSDAIDSAPGNDRSVLKAATRATPRDFSMGMDAAGRNLYAASVLTKLRIWEYPGDAASGSAGAGGQAVGQLSFQSVRSPDGNVEGSLLGRAGVHGRVILVLPDSVLSIGMRGSFPASWLAEPDRWAAIVPARAEAVVEWREEVRRQLGAGHPLRVWAEEAANLDPAGKPAQPAARPDAR